MMRSTFTGLSGKHAWVTEVSDTVDFHWSVRKAWTGLVWTLHCKDMRARAIYARSHLVLSRVPLGSGGHPPCARLQPSPGRPSRSSSTSESRTHHTPHTHTPSRTHTTTTKPQTPSSTPRRRTQAQAGAAPKRRAAHPAYECAPTHPCCSRSTTRASPPP